MDHGQQRYMYLSLMYFLGLTDITSHHYTAQSLLLNLQFTLKVPSQISAYYLSCFGVTAGAGVK